jgi:hypothetical protein
VKQEETEREEKEEEKENGKNISKLVYSALLFTWVDPFGGGTSMILSDQPVSA